MKDSIKTPIKILKSGSPIVLDAVLEKDLPSCKAITIELASKFCRVHHYTGFSEDYGYLTILIKATDESIYLDPSVDRFQSSIVCLKDFSSKDWEVFCYCCVGYSVKIVLFRKESA